MDNRKWLFKITAKLIVIHVNGLKYFSRDIDNGIRTKDVIAHSVSRLNKFAHELMKKAETLKQEGVLQEFDSM